MMRDHGRCHDSDAAKVQLSSGQRSLAQAKEFPNSNDPNGPRCVQRSGYYGKGDYPRPHPERGQSARLRHRTTKKNDTAKYTIKVCLLILLQSTVETTDRRFPLVKRSSRLSFVRLLELQFFRVSLFGEQNAPVFTK